MSARTNEEWVADLAPENPNRAETITDLRAILLTGLKRGLAGKIDAVGNDFDTLMEDFAQEALLKVLGNYLTFEGRSRFTTWAHKIAVHVALSELRRKRWRDRSLDGMLETDEGDYTPSFIADETPGPDARAEQADLVSKVRRIISEELTEKQRTALIAATIEGVPFATIAEEMQMKPNAVYKLLHDARLRLKQRLLLEGLAPAEILAVFEN